MLYFDRPSVSETGFVLLTGNIEGTVAEIGWRITRVTFDHRPLYVLIPSFSSISVENPGRMTNRRIKRLWVTLRRCRQIGLIVDAIRNMLQAHSDIDRNRRFVGYYFNEFATLR